MRTVVWDYCYDQWIMWPVNSGAHDGQPEVPIISGDTIIVFLDSNSSATMSDS